MTIEDVRAMLLERAESYSRDARALDDEGDNFAAAAYRTIADELRKAGFAGTGNPIRATPEGIAAIADSIEALPTGPALLEYWRGQLGKRERLILDAMVAAYPDALDHAAVCEATGYSPDASTVGAGMSTLRGLELVDGWRASDDFMDAIA